VLVRGDDGAIVTVADTREHLRPCDGIEEIGIVKEGSRGGERYPSNHADDDGDGQTDEDRLDSVDNDGDGRVDEDFAAIGDEMIVMACETTGDAAPIVGDGQPVASRSVTLHQECYAWSLAHIDGMVAMKLTVRNTGTEPLEDLRVGAVFERPHDFEVSTENVADTGSDAFQLGEPLTAKAMTLTDGDWPALAALFVSHPGERDETSWLTGAMPRGRSLADVVRASNRPDALARPDRRYVDPDAEGAGTDNPSQLAGTGKEGFAAYGISPVLGTLDPGGEIELYFALISVDDRKNAERAIEDAYRTIEGDSEHRMIPPPVSITRRTLWGSYELRVPGDAAAGVTLTITDPHSQGVNPAEILRLQGIDLRGATRTVSPSGDVVFEITGEMPEEIQTTRRVVLSGQTNSGQLFNAVLRPIGVESGVESVAAAERYWNTAGRLEEALLNNSPNPFRVATTIYYEVPTTLVDENGAEVQFSGMVDTSVKVYNVAGRLVSTLVESTQGPGHYDAQWNASNGDGAGVASGVYYVKLQIGKRFITKRLIQLK
jgi:hypothetical protein